MRKVRNNKNLKIIASISVVLFSLVATFSGAIAWFQALRDAGTNNSNFDVRKGDSINVDYELYRYDSERKTGIMDEDNTNFVLPSYDTFLTSRNINNSIFLKIDIDFLTPTSQSKNIKLTASCTESYLDNQSHVKAVSSNIVYFSSLLVSTRDQNGNTTEYATVDFTNANTTYTSAKSAFTNQISKHSFVSGNPLAKNSTSLSLYDNNGLSIPTGKTGATILLKYDYSDSLVNNYIENCGEDIWDSTVLTSEFVEFSADINSIEVKYEET